MGISAEEVRRLRELTGAGMMDCKRALEEAGGDIERAQDILRTRGLAAAGKRAGKVAGEGVVESYIHMNGKLGVLVEVNCETDFVANTDEFRTLARDLAMQIAAADPWWIARDQVPEDVLDQERKIFEARAREEGKPDQVIPRIVEGRLEAFYRERCLLDQPFFKDMEGKRTAGDLLAEVSAKVGEKVEVRRFARFVRGEDVAERP
ncbi:MAG TPA: translation elongation factor Ts [Actinomycetota bacterium]|nr:translation elongation factor Ts [Actinomycetota bacterium]